MRVEQRIVALLVLENELTINQISTKLGESYAFVHRKIKELLAQRVVFKKTIGHSSLITLNRDSDRLRALLHLHEVERKENFLAKNEDYEDLSEELRGLPVRCAVFSSSHNRLFLISKKKIPLKTTISFTHMTPQAFKQDEELRKSLQEDRIILEGFHFFIETTMGKRNN